MPDLDKWLNWLNVETHDTALALAFSATETGDEDLLLFAKTMFTTDWHKEINSK